MKPRIIVSGFLLAVLVLGGTALAQKDTNQEPTAILTFVVIREENGKPVRNAAVVMHPVNQKGKQERGGLELKTDPQGKTSFDGIPFGKLRVQVLAHGFQTYGEDFDIDKAKVEITVKLKRPQGQFSIYEDHSKDSAASPKQDAPPEAKTVKPD